MSGSFTILASTRSPGRLIARATSHEAGNVYLVERRSPSEPPPSHACLPPVQGTTVVDGHSVWVIQSVPGNVLKDCLRAGGPLPGSPLEKAALLGEAVAELERLDLVLADFYPGVLVAKGELLLDYCGLWLGSLPEQPSFPQLQGLDREASTVCILAAVLHGCATGKPATDPPYVFNLPTAVSVTLPYGVEAVIQGALKGKLTLADFIDRVKNLEAEQRLNQLFGSRSFGTGMEATPGPGQPKMTRAGQVADWALWAICMVLGIVVVVRWG